MESIKKFIKPLPFIGGLANCNLLDFKRASEDIFTNFIFSTMPLWLGAYISLILNQDISFISAIVKNLKNGELILLATATLGPIVYIALGDLGGGNDFPTKLSHITLIIIMVILSATTFGLHRTNENINQNVVFYVSLIFFVFSWFLLWLATVYKRQSVPPSAPKLFKKQEENFAKKLKKHRSGQ
jgi:hypothetical protein